MKEILLNSTFQAGKLRSKISFPQLRNVQHDSFHSAFQGLPYACDYLNSKWFYHADILKLVYLILMYYLFCINTVHMNIKYYKAYIEEQWFIPPITPRTFNLPGFSYTYVPSCGPKYTSLPSLGQSTLNIIHQISAVVQTLPCYFGQLNIQNKHDYCYMYIVHSWGKLCPLITSPFSFSPSFSFLRVNKCFIKQK